MELAIVVSGPSLGALRAIEKLRRVIDELAELERTQPEEAARLVSLIARFTDDWREERCN